MRVESDALGFIESVHMNLQNRGYGSDWNAQQLADQLIKVMNYPATAVPVTYSAEDSLDEVPNDRMIHEMLKRGFAVMKLPECGG